MTAQCVVATPRQRQIAVAQANARRFASASILGRVVNRERWNLALWRNEQYDGTSHGFAVYAYYSRLHTRGYAERDTNIPHGCPIRYKLRVYPKLGQLMLDEGR